MVNGMLRSFTGADVADFGCAFNAYSRSAIEPVIGVIGKQKFTKALVLSAGASVVEVDLSHQARADSSRYSPFRLIRLALHVLAGFWPQPIQWAGVTIGAICGLLTLAVGIWGIVFWIAKGDFPGLLFLGGLVLGVLAVQGFILALRGRIPRADPARRRGPAALHDRPRDRLLTPARVGRAAPGYNRRPCASASS